MHLTTVNSAVAEWVIRTYVGPQHVKAFHTGTVFMCGAFPPTSPWSTNKSNESWLCQLARQFAQEDVRSVAFYYSLHSENAEIKKAKWFQKPINGNFSQVIIEPVAPKRACEDVIRACKKTHSDLLTIFADPIYMPLIMARVVALLKRERLFNPATGKLDLRKKGDSHHLIAKSVS